MEKKGWIALVGAGPGDPGLITWKGLKRLRECQALVYDSLVCQRLLEEAPRNCRKIYVGKRAGRHSMKQEEINQILIELSAQGLNTVRLKGGDPFVFGRGGEEAIALASACVPYEVIPGVTAATGAPMAVGIPVTHRSVSRSVHLITGHTMEGKEGLPEQLPILAELSGTLVFYMGLNNLSAIVDALLKNGKRPDTPAALIESGTLPWQRWVRGRLDTIEAEAEKENIASPALIVIGPAASMDLRCGTTYPLLGAAVGVTGTDSFTGKLRETLENLGAYTERPLSMEIVSMRREEAMKKAYKELPSFHWIVFTSSNGVEEFFKGLLEDRKDFRKLSHVKFAVIGEGTAQKLESFGFFYDYMPSSYCAEDLGKGLAAEVKEGEKVLIPRSAAGSPELTRSLKEAGVDFLDVALYQAKERKEIRSVNLEHLNYLVFASGSGVQGFFKDSGLTVPKRTKLVCIGRITAKALEEWGYKADLTASDYTVTGIADVLALDWEKEKSNLKI
ncbi:MAG TPA: uroporphyrinogen-III C-methyltransferase [Candidatus Hungatella pullicola]|nr:uroporphyrinogen-III C-methyltransferase [Candidatus Hungatella pullicola]